jgi:hypothetical protein
MVIPNEFSMPAYSRSRPVSARGPVQASDSGPRGVGAPAAVRREPAATGGPEGAVLARARRAPSAPLPYRAELETSFGSDLAEVRAWLGVDLAGIGAEAAAAGTDVFFTAAAPSREQVGEEVAHVLQGHHGTGTSRPSDAAEHEAVDAGARAARGEPVEIEARSDGHAIHRDAVLPSHAGDPDAPATGELKLAPGTTCTVGEVDLAGGEAAAWNTIARAHGMKVGHLVAFNQHVSSVAIGGVDSPRPVTPTLTLGTVLYLPSADEILLSQCRARSPDLAAAEQLYGTVAAGANDEILTSARARATGAVGEGYGTPGVDGHFYSPNPGLAGASRRRTERLDGRTEYRIDWAPDFWKCSVFLNDVTFQAGWQPAITANGHYALAGNIDTSPHYREVPVAAALPGNLWQKDGGNQADESHNAVLSSFVTVAAIDDATDRWSFDIVGAELSRAAESERTYTMRKGTNQTTADQVIRFFAPVHHR